MIVINMIDTTPVEWIFANFFTLSVEDQKKVFKPFLFDFCGPFLLTYFLASYRAHRYRGSLLKKVARRYLYPTILGAVVVDISYYYNYSRYQLLYQELSKKY